MVHQGKIAVRLIAAILTVSLIHRGEIEQHAEWPREIPFEEPEHLTDPLLRNPHGRNVVARHLRGEDTLTKLVDKFLYEDENLFPYTTTIPPSELTEEPARCPLAQIRLRIRPDYVGSWQRRPTGDATAGVFWGRGPGKTLFCTKKGGLRRISHKMVPPWKRISMENYTSSGLRNVVAAVLSACRRSRMLGMDGLTTSCGPTIRLRGLRSRPTASCRRRSPCTKASGRGGQPGTYTSTGRNLSTPCTTL